MQLADAAGRLQQLVVPTDQCLVCHEDIANGWPVGTCFTKHSRIGYMALLMDILVPGEGLAR